jgi:two-component sensor histidine kinase
MTSKQDFTRGDAAVRIGELETALARKTALAQEIDHRVKNTLQLISSLMLLQSRRITDETARHALKSMLERVSAVSAVHRRLFQGDDSSGFEVADFVRDLASDLAVAAGRDDILLDLDLQRISIAPSAAAPFALLFNEILGNALKHAYPVGQGGRIGVGVAAEDGACVLTIADRGQGLGGRPPGFGLTIVQLMGRQLHAAISTEATGTGVKVVIRVPAIAA